MATWQIAASFCGYFLGRWIKSIFEQFKDELPYIINYSHLYCLYIMNNLYASCKCLNILFYWIGKNIQNMQSN